MTSQCTRCGQTGHRASQCTMPIPHCTRCGRTLRNPVEIDGRQYGSTCARTLFGARQPRPKRSTGVVRDALTMPLFEVVA